MMLCSPSALLSARSRGDWEPATFKSPAGGMITGFAVISRLHLRLLHSVTSLRSSRLLNANKIACLRVDAFQDLHNLNLLSLYDNKLQTIAKGTFSSLRAIQTL